MVATVGVSIAAASLAIEAAVGYPAWLYARIGHPVTWMGALIAAIDAGLNRDDLSPATRRRRGVLGLAILLGCVAAVTVAIAMAAPRGIWGVLFLAVPAASLPAQRSLHDHVRWVADALDTKGLEAGREAVARIVGRNTAVLDEAGVARAAIESLAENFSDGVAAPAFWTAVGGLAGGAVYKAANTADSMIGHRTPRHEAFGWAAARFDDAINLPASRLAALWLVLAACLLPGASPGGAVRATWRDAGRHRSPNAGWPEAAMAGALGLRLAGPRVYGAVLVEDAYMGDGADRIGSAEIRHALALYRLACLLQLIVLAALALTLRG